MTKKNKKSAGRKVKNAAPESITQPLAAKISNPQKTELLTTEKQKTEDKTAKNFEAEKIIAIEKYPEIEIEAKNHPEKRVTTKIPRVERPINEVLIQEKPVSEKFFYDRELTLRKTGEIENTERPANSYSLFRGSIIFGFLLSRRLVIETVMTEIPALKIPLLRVCSILESMAKEGGLPKKPLHVLITLPQLSARIIDEISSPRFIKLLDSILLWIIKSPKLSNEERDGVLSSLIYLKFHQDKILNPSENPFWETLLRYGAQKLMNQFPPSAFLQAAGYPKDTEIALEALADNPFYYRFMIKSAIERTQIAFSAAVAGKLSFSFPIKKLRSLSQDMIFSETNLWKQVHRFFDSFVSKNSPLDKLLSCISQDLTWLDEEHFRNFIEERSKNASGAEKDILDATRFTLDLFPYYENPVLMALYIRSYINNAEKT